MPAAGARVASVTSEHDSAEPADAAAPAAAPLKPLDVDGVRTVLWGTVLWVVAFVVLLFLRDDLEESGRSWWLWTCLAGAGLGLIGFEYARRRRDAIARVRVYQADHADSAPGDPSSA